MGFGIGLALQAGRLSLRDSSVSLLAVLLYPVLATVSTECFWSFRCLRGVVPVLRHGTLQEPVARNQIE
ncbi:hypothetical protein GCM10010170_096650 [Dactylosporangium salmoneum]|uniref:Uncharacterized protein n=1 Tax=Dactylosporangium salmoneum TaxID=53361 RepID=A0ABN3HS32_9ACTN